MATKREWLVEQNLATPGRGRFSREANAALDKAISEGIVFDDNTPAKIPSPRITATDSTVKVRVVGGGPVPIPRESYNPKDVRAWAKGKGIPVGERGRIDHSIVAQYLADSKVIPSPRPPAKEYVSGDTGKFVPNVLPSTYPWDTKFKYTDESGKTFIVGSRNACRCGVSLSECRCGNPHTLIGGRSNHVPVIPILPKGKG